MIQRSLLHFPELRGREITVGYTRVHLGSAFVAHRAGRISQLVIRLKTRKLTYQTIGHELTHLVQALARFENGNRPAGRWRIPSGEKPCDIWTLARAPLFCDDPPSYVRMPRRLRERWRDYAAPVRALCVAAIEKRQTHRRYIRWLEAELRRLPGCVPQPPAREQLRLPFDAR
ncbi:MAG TPA: hypothetical protein VNO43_18570 [Candidatus Eisenbacteria bacterium]|nr:hypothetical protein [Candidatus Eisenbacteria bacterium]